MLIANFVADENLEEGRQIIKKHVKSNFLMIVGFDKDYTKILAEDGKLYMVKGLNR